MHTAQARLNKMLVVTIYAHGPSCAAQASSVLPSYVREANERRIGWINPVVSKHLSGKVVCEFVTLRKSNHRILLCLALRPIFKFK